MSSFKVFVAIFLLTSAYPIFAAEPDPAATKSLQRFVQEFYDWYAPHSVSDGPLPAVDLALKQKPSVFSARLGDALRDDSIARAKTPDMIVGLDFDPFLASQDPCVPYEVGQVVKDGNRYKVSIFEACNGKKADRATVVAELEHKASSWVFVNFDYPGSGDLMTALGLLKKEHR